MPYRKGHQRKVKSGNTYRKVAVKGTYTKTRRKPKKQKNNILMCVYTP